MRRLRNRRAGFTLIETLLVMSVIATLIAILVQSLPFIEGKIRDRKRLYELSSLQRVLEIYHSDNNSYPATAVVPGSYYTFVTDNDGSVSTLPSPTQVSDIYIPQIVPSYFASLPRDPKPGASSNAGCVALNYDRNIIYISNGDHYKLIFQCVSETNEYDPASWFYDPNRFNYAWAVSDDINYTSGTLGW